MAVSKKFRFGQVRPGVFGGTIEPRYSASGETPREHSDFRRGAHQLSSNGICEKGGEHLGACPFFVVTGEYAIEAVTDV